MSLSAHLNDRQSPVRRFILARFPAARTLALGSRERLLGTTPIRPSRAAPHDLIGMALDYRLRYYFGQPSARQSVAWLGAALACGAGSTLAADGSGPIAAERRLPATAVADFFGGFSGLLRHVQPARRRLEAEDEARLASYCLVLALFEQIYRAGAESPNPLLDPHPLPSATALLASLESHWIEDVCALSYAFRERHFGLVESTVKTALNPTFEGSGDVGGADADLILDDCLIEIKATVYPRVDPRWLHQLIGYLLLDYDDRYAIRQVGVYLARQAMLLRWPLATLMGPATPPARRLAGQLDLFATHDLEVSVASTPLVDPLRLLFAARVQLRDTLAEATLSPPAVRIPRVRATRRTRPNSSPATALPLWTA